MNIKETILSGWSFMRAFRMFFGVLIIIQGVQQHNVMYAILGLLFTSMSVFNIGCCGSNGCAVPNKKRDNTINDISYEEVGK